MVKSKWQRSWLSDLLFRLAMASGVGYLATAYSVSRRLTRATPGQPRTTPREYGLPCERLTCRTADRIRLVGWAVTPAQPWATVVLFHGMRHSREHLLGRIAFLAAAGCRCVAFDHRAHGESGGRKTSFGYYESRDVAAVLELVRRRWPAEPLAALGMSMGAAALCFAANHLRDVRAVILESLYHDIAGAFANRIGSHYPAWFKRLRHGVIWMTERRLGLKLNQLSPAEHIGNLAPAPILLLTGKDDIHASPADAARLCRRCRGPRELWLVPYADHRGVLEAGGHAYQRRVLDFLSRWLPQPAAAYTAAV